MNIVVTGASSGIGKELAKVLVKNGNRVFGLARRKGVREKFEYLAVDISDKFAWRTIKTRLKKIKFSPDAVIFNAAILENDLDPRLSYQITEKIHRINFLSVIKGVEELMQGSKSCHFIAISSTAALRGSSVESLGYSSSKAALSLAFEALYQKFKGSKFKFSIVYFGPVRGGMSPFKRSSPFQLEMNEAVNAICKALKERAPAYYYPWWIFFVLKLIRILPGNLDLSLFSLLENFHRKNRL